MNDSARILPLDLLAERDAKGLLGVFRRPDQSEGARGCFDEAQERADAGAGADEDDAVEECCYAHNTTGYMIQSKVSLQVFSLKKIYRNGKTYSEHLAPRSL